MKNELHNFTKIVNVSIFLTVTVGLVAWIRP